MRALSDWAFIFVAALWLGLLCAGVVWILHRLRDALRRHGDESWLLEHRIDPYHLAGDR